MPCLAARFSEALTPVWKTRSEMRFRYFRANERLNMLDPGARCGFLSLRFDPKIAVGLKQFIRPPDAAIFV